MNGIIMTADSVCGMLDNRKTATRRVMTPQPVMDESGMWRWKDCQWLDGGLGFPLSGIEDHAPHKPGDILYVKEAWITEGGHYYYRADYDNGRLDRCETLGGGYPVECRYHPGCEGCMREGYKPRWRSSMFMPRAAARIFLRITDVRVERVQQISDEDCYAEGIDPQDVYALDPETGYPPPHVLFEWHWYAINGKRKGGIYAWDKNPFVWVYTFEPISREEAERGDAA